MRSYEVKTILKDEDYLRQKSKEVSLDDASLKEDILVLKDFCSKEDVLAISAIQLGIPKRIIYLKNTNLEVVQRFQNKTETAKDKLYDEEKVLINPIFKKKEGLTEYWEACRSCLDNVGLVKRPYKIVLEYTDLDGNICKEAFTGFPATVLAHEMDHLEGILHMDIAEKVLVMNKEERQKFRQTHDYQILSKKGNYEDLIK